MTTQTPAERLPPCGHKVTLPGCIFCSIKFAVTPEQRAASAEKLRQVRSRMIPGRLPPPPEADLTIRQAGSLPFLFEDVTTKIVNHHRQQAYFSRTVGADEQWPQAARPTPQPAAQPAAPLTTPGSELEAIFASLGVDKPPGCDCSSIRNWMNRIGVEGCKRHRLEIIRRLKENYQKVPWGAVGRAAMRGVLSGLVVNPLDPIPALLDLAIGRAAAKQPAAVNKPAESKATDNTPPGPQ